MKLQLLLFLLVSILSIFLFSLEVDGRKSLLQKEDGKDSKLVKQGTILDPDSHGDKMVANHQMKKPADFDDPGDEEGESSEDEEGPAEDEGEFGDDGGDEGEENGGDDGDGGVIDDGDGGVVDVGDQVGDNENDDNNSEGEEQNDGGEKNDGDNVEKVGN